MNNKYTEEWFNDDRNYDFDSEDLKAIKERFEHLSKMMDELNEKLKNGDESAHRLTSRIKNYVHGTLNAIESDYQYMSCGHANRMVTY